MTSPPERPWDGTAWDSVVVVGEPWWRRALARPLVVLFALVLLVPFASMAWVLLEHRGDREAVRALLYDEVLEEMEPGTCVDELGEGDARTLTPVSCEGPHDGEVTGRVALSAGAYPGEDEVMDESDRLCAEATEQWVADGAGKGLDLVDDYFYPLREGWAEGRTTTVCFALGGSGQKLLAPLR